MKRILYKKAGCAAEQPPNQKVRLELYQSIPPCFKLSVYSDLIVTSPVLNRGARDYMLTSALC